MRQTIVSRKLLGIGLPLLGRQEVRLKLTTTTRKIGDITVVDCNGPIVLGEESTALRIFVKDLLSKSPQIVLDLGAVNHIDSGGLGTLVGLHTSAKSSGGSIKLAHLHPRLGELLQVTKLVTVFDVYDTAENAAAAFRKAASAS